MSQPAYPAPLPAAAVAARLAEAVAGPQHRFWPDDLTPVVEKTLAWAKVLGHRQVTNAYLLALALKHGGRFVTLRRARGFADRLGR
jgi:predicted nucleic acid-binding protein